MNLRKNNIRFLNKRNFFQFFFLLLLIFINRLAIPGFASLSVSIILLIFFIIFSAINNTILLDKRNLIIYCIMLSLLFLSTSVSMFVSIFSERKKKNQLRKQAYEAGSQQKILRSSRVSCRRRSDCFFIFCYFF